MRPAFLQRAFGIMYSMSFIAVRGREQLGFRLPDTPQFRNLSPIPCRLGRHLIHSLARNA